MASLNMNFAPTRRRLAGVEVVALLVAAVICAFVFEDFLRVRGERERIADQLRLVQQRLDRTSGRPAKPAADAVALAEEGRRAAAIVELLATPWAGLFGELEAAAVEDVSLTGIEPDPAGNQVRLSGEAKSFAALVKYIGALEARPAFRDAWLASHEVRQVSGRRVVAFSLATTWVKGP